jgi:asparagine synthase (glutamine-hydrolysing)
MYWDLLSYLPGDILVKLDRAARHTGLQLRLPLLDQQLVEFAWRIPIDLKLRDGQGKWLLRQVACRYLPRELLERPKMGFSPPIASWLRGPLREWAEELLQPDRLAQQGLLEPQLVRRTWEAHQVGRQDAALPMWSVLMFQAWYDEQQQRLSPALAERAIREQLQPVLAEEGVLSPVS